MQTFRQHSSILHDAGGAVAIRRLLVERDVQVSAPTVQSWITRNSIPAAYWADLVAMSFTTLEELAEAAKASTRTTPTASNSYPQGESNARTLRLAPCTIHHRGE